MDIEKLDLSSPDLVQGNIEKIRALFPNVVTEGPEGLSIDFDALRQELSDTIVEGPQERYRLDWPGKRAAMLAANTPISKTLRPVREESVDFDTTQNLFIEGDNLDALKLLQDSYLGKVKMIYIDPPYNTGKDFIYKDNFTQDKGEYLEESGQVDEDGGRLVANPESNGRYHSDWLSMMYPRLKLARNLLRDDGVIFISINDVEVTRLNELCSNIFGSSNFIAQFVWKSRISEDNRKITGVSADHEYILVYGKTDSRLSGVDKDLDKFKNPDNDTRGPWRSADLTGLLTADLRPNCHYDLVNPDTKLIYSCPPKGWRYDKNTMAKKIAEYRIIWPKDTNGRPRHKLFMKEMSSLKKNISSVITKFNTQQGTREIDQLFEPGTFDYPKPSAFIQFLIDQTVTNGDLILDFFSGSSSTAHAAYKQALSKRIELKCISVQLPETTDTGSPANRLGYTTIAEISKERIRRAGAKILEENPDQLGKLDIGFRVLKIDSSNMKDVHADPRELKQGELLDAVSHIKPDRSGEDLLFQVMLNQGIELSQSIARETVEGKTVYIVGQDNLIACFDDNITDDVVKNIAGRKPLYAIFRDESFKEPADKINAAQIFKQLTEGHTRIKVI